MEPQNDAGAALPPIFRQMRLAEPLLEVLNRYAPPAVNTRSQAEMSRARFAVTQFTSVLVALATCCTLIIIALSKMDNLQDLFTGPCGLENLLLHTLNETTNATCPNNSPLFQ